jgi:hypothetical protein
MALSSDGSFLFPILEHPLVGRLWLNIYAFDLERGRYTHLEPDSSVFRYRLDSTAISVAEFTLWRGEDYLAIERDAEQGTSAALKKVFLVNPNRLDREGHLAKREMIDLLDIADPHDLGGSGTGRFTFPFETTEALVVVNENTVGLINDNNYPFGRARSDEPGGPDRTEFILVRLPQVR